MRVIVFGATSRLGRQVWRKALDAGHQVTVFGRLVKRLSEEESALKTIMGDLIDAGAVPKAIARQDAVIVCLGTDYREEHAEPSASTNIIVNAMVRYDVKRLVVATTTEDGLYKEKTSMMDNIFQRFVARILPRFAAWAGTGVGSGVGSIGGFGGYSMHGGHAPQEDFIRDSPLDWTIVRAPVINDRLAPGWVERGTNVSREDVASFMVKQLTDLTNNHRTVTARSSEGSPPISEPHAAEPTPSEPPSKGKFDDYPLGPGAGTKNDARGGFVATDERDRRESRCVRGR